MFKFGKQQRNGDFGLHFSALFSCIPAETPDAFPELVFHADDTTFYLIPTPNATTQNREELLFPSFRGRLLSVLVASAPALPWLTLSKADFFPIFASVSACLCTHHSS